MLECEFFAYSEDSGQVSFSIGISYVRGLYIVIRYAISMFVRFSLTGGCNQVNSDLSMIGDGVFIGQPILGRGLIGV